MTIQQDSKPAGLAQKIVSHYEVTDRLTGKVTTCYTRRAAERMCTVDSLSGAVSATHTIVEFS